MGGELQCRKAATGKPVHGAVIACVYELMDKFYFNECIGRDMNYQKYKYYYYYIFIMQIKRVTLSKIWLREKLEIKTIQPTKYLKWTTKF